jgi:hypothetical protein
MAAVRRRVVSRQADRRVMPTCPSRVAIPGLGSRSPLVNRRVRSLQSSYQADLLGSAALGMHNRPAVAGQRDGTVLWPV